MPASSWLPSHADAVPRRRALQFALGGHLASRIAYHLAGVRFDESPLGGYWQYVDPALLRERLWQSLLYLHSQPPVFNLFLGVVLKLFPVAHAAAFHLCFLGFGLGLTACFVTLALRLGVRPWLAGALGVIFAASPPVALYEQWLFYPTPTALLVCGSAVALHRFAERQRARDAALAFGLLAAVVLTRSLFHLGWLVLVFAVTLWRVPARRAAWRGFLPAFAACLALYLKNLVLFGFFGASSWLGMSLGRAVTLSVPGDDVRAWVREGKLSRYALIAPFQDLSMYKALDPSVLGPPTGIPVLDEEVSANGSTNFNHRAYLQISRCYAEDVRRVLRLAPRAPLWGLEHGVYNFLRPASELPPPFLRPNADRIRGFDRLFNIAVFGQLRASSFPPQDEPIPLAAYARETGLWITASYLVALVAGGLVLVRRLRGPAGSEPSTVTWAYLWLTVLYVTGVGNLLEVGENNRFRFLADPLVLAMLAALATSWRPWRRAQPAAAPA